MLAQSSLPAPAWLQGFVGKFWWFWGVAAFFSAVIVCFFLGAVTNGAVSGSNLLPWMAILLALSGVTVGSLWLRSHGRPGLALLPVLLMSVPAVLLVLGVFLWAIFYFVVFLTGNGRMN